MADSNKAVELFFVFRFRFRFQVGVGLVGKVINESLFDTF